jgi:hypothetical protein
MSTVAQQLSIVNNARRSGDLTPIRQLAVSGYASDTVRWNAWRVLLRIVDPDPVTHGDVPTEQVLVDVGRSLRHVDEARRAEPQALLISVLTQFEKSFSRGIAYTQGLNSIAEHVISFNNEKMAVALLVVLGTGALRPFVSGSGVHRAMALADFLGPLLRTISPGLAHQVLADGLAPVMNFVLF